MFQTFLNILGVIGIVIVAAFVIVFLSDLFISIVDGTNGIFFKRNKDKRDDDDDDDRKQIATRPILLNKPHEEVEEDEYDERKSKNVKKEDVVVKKDPVYEDDSDEEREIDFKEAEREAELIRQQNANRQNVVNQRTQNQRAFVTPPPAPRPAPAPAPKPAPVSPKQEEEDIDSLIAEISKETLKEIEKQEVNTKAKEEQDAMVKKQKELEAEISRLKNQIESDKATIKTLEEQVNNKPEPEVQVKVETVKVPTGNKEELENRLEVLRQRLKDNEKELSANRKEYNPLRRVNMTLENDKKKLRRKEAIVAKQKVVLYGVNNYVDIDEEKAKKLSEELDLLEGLRLSVQHCEEVMQKNKDRFPILERTNKFLLKSNAELKEDIANLEQQIKDLEEKDANGEE